MKTTTIKTDPNKEEKVGQGELYSPEFAIEVKAIEQQKEREVAISSPPDADAGNGNLVALKDKLMEKLAAAATSFLIPEEHARALGKAGELLENMVKDASTTTKDAIQNFKTYLAQIFPHEETSKMVDDAEREAANPEQEGVKEANKGHKDKNHKGEGEENQQGGKYTHPSVMPSASQFTPKL